ncbi:Rpn family recombination-promoting nuclease/putative transposase [Treponema vincentii]|uniref:Rpn family recombination-promoting nuclease/putative transposase n=1 Tax=Treponema vincentii TaxID=69710 RepID=UPI0020A5E9B1|nr:Rpn family recombination-promoting nuclease/putative transposase [Treponema vincentii]UTC48138.1 Rpn family recombination-promoting nuclease/putative transposase [Treponema vincentii]
MENTYTLTLKNDYLFKLLLGSEENKACLQDFLECVLDMPAGMITGLELLDKELSKDEITDKTGILDVKLRLKDGTTIDIEIQNSWSTEFIPRTLFYWAKMYIEGFKEGEPYTSLTRCIAINLISQGFKLNSEVHSAYRILEQQTYQQLTDLLEIHFLNLAAVKGTKIRQAITTKKQEKLLNWLRFIETDDKEERAMLATTSPILQMLNEKIDVLSLNPEERKLYESRMKLKSDIATISEVQFKAGVEWGLAEGKTLGLAEGEARGRSEGSRQKALETARILKQLGDSVQKIAQATGLTQAEVEAIK